MKMSNLQNGGIIMLADKTGRWCMVVSLVVMSEDLKRPLAMTSCAVKTPAKAATG